MKWFDDYRSIGLSEPMSDAADNAADASTEPGAGPMDNDDNDAGAGAGSLGAKGGKDDSSDDEPSDDDGPFGARWTGGGRGVVASVAAYEERRDLAVQARDAAAEGLAIAMQTNTIVLQTRDVVLETNVANERRLAIAQEMEEIDARKREADLAATNARIAAEAAAAIEQIKRDQEAKHADARRDSAMLNERHVARQVEMQDNAEMNRQTLDHLKQERKAQGGASEDDDEDDSDDERPKKRGRRGGGGCGGGSSRGGRGNDNDPRGGGHEHYSSTFGHYDCSGW